MIRVRRVAIATLCALLLAGCRFPGQVRPVVKVGLVAPFEGRYRYVGYDVIYAVRLAVREVNAAGGIGGYSVELVAYDDGADPEMAVTQALKLGVDPDVMAVIGHFGDETTLAALDSYTSAGLPLVAPGVLSPLTPQGGHAAYLLAPDAVALAEALLARVAGDHGARDVVLVSEGDPLGVALIESAAAHNLSITLVAPDDPDCLAVTTAAHIVVCDADPVTAGELAAALSAAGWEGILMGGPPLAAGDFRAVAGNGGTGAVFVTPYPYPLDLPGMDGFVADYEASGYHVPPPGPLAVPAYEAAWLLFDALERDLAADGVPARDGMAAALAELVDIDPALYWYRIGADGVPELEP